MPKAEARASIEAALLNYFKKTSAHNGARRVIFDESPL
jgi:hypothetical protein